MKILLFTFFISLIAFQSCQIGEEENSSIVGEYKLTGFNMDAALTLRHDKTFYHKVSILSCFGTGDMKEFKGTYSIYDDKVIFKPDYFITTEYFEDVPARDSSKYVSSEHLFRDTLNIIEWSNNVFLLSEEELSLWGYSSKNDFIEFVNDINSGYDFHFDFGSYWKKQCKCGNNVDLNKVIPIPWKDLLLNKVIEAHTISIEPYNSKKQFEMIKSIVTIDVGALSGVKNTMKFYADNREDCACDVEIFEVTDKTSKGYTSSCGPDDCRIGALLSTNLKRRNSLN